MYGCSLLRREEKNGSTSSCRSQTEKQLACQKSSMASTRGKKASLFSWSSFALKGIKINTIFHKWKLPGTCSCWMKLMSREFYKWKLWKFPAITGEIRSSPNLLMKMVILILAVLAGYLFLSHVYKLCLYLDLVRTSRRSQQQSVLRTHSIHISRSFISNTYSSCGLNSH